MVFTDTVAPRPAPSPSSRPLPELLYATDLAASDVVAGRYDALLPAGGVPVDERWFARIDGDDDLDLWLISWVPGQPTELHDHGDSLGALTLLTGSLDEFRWEHGRLRRRRLDAGAQAAFPLGWVHDVVWAPAEPVEIAPAAPTLSIHAYSPPLTTMSYYQVGADNALQRQRTEATDEPES